MRTRYFGGLCLIFLCMASLCFVVTGVTYNEDASALYLMSLLWENTVPINWISGTDPCDSHWEGVTCTDGRITSLKLSSVGLKGALSNKIGSLTALQTLDLSYNKDLAGRLPNSIGNLVSLKILIVIGCNFNGHIPTELGNLTNLSFLALNSNKFTGPIPPTLGKLTNLEWLDIADNELTGSLPVSNATQSGLDKLINTQHFHFNLNHLSGTIPPELFSGNMNLLHILFDSNEFEGQIPTTLGLVNTLTVLRLDRNQITGSIPSNISNLVSLEELNLSNNKLNGDIPDLSTLNELRYIDLSNNSYNSFELPRWVTDSKELIAIVMDNCSVSGFSSTNFNLPALQTVRMKNNKLNGIVKIDISDSRAVQWIDLRNNNITEADVEGNTAALWIAGNPVCNPGTSLSSTKSCQNIVSEESYETNMAQCANNKCSGDLTLNPRTCKCQQPYEGLLKFRAPSFSDLTDTERFKNLEESLKTKLGVDAVHLCRIHFDSSDYLIISVQLFPVDTELFTRSEVIQIGFNLSKQVYKPPEGFGPFFFIATPYIIGTEEYSKGLRLGIIVGIAFGAFVLALVVIITGLYALRQKKRAEKAIEIHKPFASWGASSMDSVNTPRLKGARWFSFAEIKEATNNFSESNAIGSGGFGRVYKAMLPEGEMVAIKRAQQGSLQGGTEFKNEIELLSRVHHKNLVGLIGFCTEQGEQMLVYDYMPNGTLRENLIVSGESTLDWARRLQIALDSAKGLNYLHELANPPIIHRDVKSNNILLDENLNGKVADFGLSKSVADGGVNAGSKSHVSTQVKGTMGYLDPEYCMTQQLSKKSDVYSFGIVLLELITGRLPIEGGKYIVVLVKNVLENGGIACLQVELMDPVLQQDNLTGFGEFLGLALNCLKDSGAERPTMREVVKELESIVDMQGSCDSITDSPQSGPLGAKGIRKLYDEDEEDISMALPVQRKKAHKSLFEYSGAYQVSDTIQPK